MRSCGAVVMGCGDVEVAVVWSEVAVRRVGEVAQNSDDEAIFFRFSSLTEVDVWLQSCVRVCVCACVCERECKRVCKHVCV